MGVAKFPTLSIVFCTTRQLQHDEEDEGTKTGVGTLGQTVAEMFN